VSGSALDSPPFDLLTPAERARLRDSAEEVDYAPGATLSAPPAEPAGVWLLLGGRVRLERQGAAAFRARSGGQGGDRPEPMSDYGPGELVALRSALTGHADGAWIALEAVRALRIPAAGLRELLAANAAFAAAVFAELARRLSGGPGPGRTRRDLASLMMSQVRDAYLRKPFFVIATQNPVDFHGTYPLPEAQLDRFLFNIIVDYPAKEEESTIIRQVTGPQSATVDKVLDAAQVLEMQELVRRVPVAEHVIDFARDLARATRPAQPEAPDFVREMVAWGAGPRAGISLITAAKTRAAIHGRTHATTVDVAAVAYPVLRHRVLTTFNAEAAGVTSDQIVKRLLEKMRPTEEIRL